MRKSGNTLLVICKKPATGIRDTFMYPRQTETPVPAKNKLLVPTLLNDPTTKDK